MAGVGLLFSRVFWESAVTGKDQQTGKQPYFDLWSYTDSVLPGVSGSYGCYRKNAGETKLF